MVQIGALLIHTFQAGQFGGGDRAGMPAEGDDLQRIRAKPGAHEVTDRQSSPLHGQPPVLHHHRERGVDEQRDHGLTAGLGLRDLNVIDGNPNRAIRLAASAAQHRIGNSPRDVPRLGVTERPRPGRAGQLAGSAGAAGLPFAVATRKLLGHIAKRGLPELPHRLW